MPAIASGKRYAQAIFEIAQEENQLEKWRFSLRRIAEVMQDPELVALLESPKLPLTLKTKLLKERLRGVSPLSLNLACLLVAKGKFKIASNIATEYERFLDAYYGIEHAEVTTAINLDDKERERLLQGLESLTGKKIVAELQIDPTTIGGVIIKIGDKLIDGSTKTRLATLRKTLVEAGR